MCVLHKVIANTKFTLLTFTFLFGNGIHAGDCDGEAANEIITQQPSNPLSVVERNNASLTWAYCQGNKSDIKGFIVYFVPPSNNSRKRILISLDIKSGKVSKSKKLVHNFAKRLELLKEDKSITFRIINTTNQDDGTYRLEIRKRANGDLFSEIKIQVIIIPEVFTTTNNTISSVATYERYTPTTVYGEKVISRENRVETHWRGIPSVEYPIPDSTEDDKNDIVVIVSICVAAGLVPFALCFIIFSLVKLIRHQRRKRKMSTPGIVLQMSETTSITTRHHEPNPRRIMESVSIMSGSSYRGSIEDSNDSGIRSAVTFGFVIPIPNISSAIQTPTTVLPIYNIEQDAGCPLVPKRKNEIKRKLIKNLQIIGQGAFGLVAKADLYEEKEGSNKHTVAVKMLKEFASREDKQDLISELNLMQGIDSHQNVVELLGCVTVTEPIWVVTGYAARGDLLGFLRRNRGVHDTTYLDLAKKPKTSLSQKQLLQMAKDVACGMTHLSHNKIIHRDLAARNVLVDEDIKCKITDFGMARKSTNYYRTRNRGRIPLKWTAVEAFNDGKYTTKSDVWSYGIVLYEIVTIGGSPYPTMGPREIIRKLNIGWRMEKPYHVNKQLYVIMQDCWADNPDDRPSFCDLSRKFSMLLGACNHDYINMKEYNGTLHGRIESTLENSSESVNEVAV